LYLRLRINSPPVRRHIHVRTIQRRNGCAPEQLQGALHISPQDFKRAGNPGFASGGQAIGIRASAQNRAGSEADGLDNVSAATDASIHQDLDLTMHRGDRQAGDYSGEDNGGGAAVFWRQLAAIVIPEK
jgi:hypothetical protein